MMKRLQVEWVDSGTFHQDQWETKAQILESVKIGKVMSVGLHFAETDDTLFLALSYDPDHGTYFGVQAIQKSSIVKVVTLRER